MGIVALALGMGVLSGLKWFEFRMKQYHHGKLLVTTDGDEQAQQDIYSQAVNSGYRIKAASATYSEVARQRSLEFLLRWRATAKANEIPAFVQELSRNAHILSIRWEAT